MARFFSSSEDLKKTFERYFDKSDFCVIGIDDKCQEAYEYALLSQDRIDTLQLFLLTKFIDLKALKDKGINIEVYLSTYGHPLNNEFKSYATVYTTKELI
ncbi:MAG: hypothetical protein LBI78_05145 [Campylobacteraceae bacterium]|nr:hypothetical protein [Campylobacteraceae bacterium]